MIVWLSSYPRSGNTLTRIMLHHVFGIAGTSAYMPERPDYGAGLAAGAPGSAVAVARGRDAVRNLHGARMSQLGYDRASGAAGRSAPAD